MFIYNFFFFFNHDIFRATNRYSIYLLLWHIFEVCFFCCCKVSLVLELFLEACWICTCSNKPAKPFLLRAKRLIRRFFGHVKYFSNYNENNWPTRASFVRENTILKLGSSPRLTSLSLVRYTRSTSKTSPSWLARTGFTTGQTCRRRVRLCSGHCVTQIHKRGCCWESPQWSDLVFCRLRSNTVV